MNFNYSVCSICSALTDDKALPALCAECRRSMIVVDRPPMGGYEYRYFPARTCLPPVWSISDPKRGPDNGYPHRVIDTVEIPYNVRLGVSFRRLHQFAGELRQTRKTLIQLHHPCAVSVEAAMMLVLGAMLDIGRMSSNYMQTGRVQHKVQTPYAPVEVVPVILA